MQIPVRRQAGPLTFVLALAAVLVPVRAYPQDQIALIIDSQGRGIYVNADPFASGPADPAAWVGSALSPPSSAAAPDLRKLAGQTARALRVDPGLVDAVIRVESGYNARARSPKGALGLMQLIPATASRFGVSDPFDPTENLRGGVTYLGHLLTRFGGNVPLSLAAYNAGEGAVLQRGGVPPFAETQDYVRKVAAAYSAVTEPHKPVAGTTSTLASSDTDSTPTGSNPASLAPIYRFVDERGVTHFEQ